MSCCHATRVCPLQKSNSKYGNEHEAVAVYSMMRGVEKFCPIYTLCIGNAFGEAALLLAAGTKVGRDSVTTGCLFHLHAVADTLFNALGKVCRQCFVGRRSWCWQQAQGGSSQ
jgi:hypothetical protein